LPCQYSVRWSGCDLGFSTVQTDVPALRPMVWMRPRIFYRADGCTCTPSDGLDATSDLPPCRRMYLHSARWSAFDATSDLLPTFTTMATACHCYLKLDFRRVDQRHCRLMVPILYEVLGFPRLHSNQYGQPLLSARHPIFVHTLHTHSLHFLSSCTRDLGLIPIPPVCGGCRARCYAAVSTRLLHFSLILLWCTRPILFYIFTIISSPCDTFAGEAYASACTR
jgi:hypothetical protein